MEEEDSKSDSLMFLLLLFLSLLWGVLLGASALTLSWENIDDLFYSLTIVGLLGSSLLDLVLPASSSWRVQLQLAFIFMVNLLLLGVFMLEIKSQGGVQGSSRGGGGTADPVDPDTLRLLVRLINDSDPPSDPPKPDPPKPDPPKPDPPKPDPPLDPTKPGKKRVQFNDNKNQVHIFHKDDEDDDDDQGGDSNEKREKDEDEKNEKEEEELSSAERLAEIVKSIGKAKEVEISTLKKLHDTLNEMDPEDISTTLEELKADISDDLKDLIHIIIRGTNTQKGSIRQLLSHADSMQRPTCNSSGMCQRPSVRLPIHGIVHTVKERTAVTVTSVRSGGGVKTVALTLLVAVNAVIPLALSRVSSSTASAVESFASVDSSSRRDKIRSASIHLAVAAGGTSFVHFMSRLRKRAPGSSREIRTIVLLVWIWYAVSRITRLTRKPT